MIIMTIFDYLI